MPSPEGFEAALAAHRAGDLALAERLYREVLARAPHGPALGNLSLILDAAGDAEGAAALLEQAAALSPDDPQAHVRLGNQARATRDLERAEQAYRRALELKPGDPEVTTDLGLTLLGLGRYAEGWPLYDARRARRRMLERGLSFPEWRGEPLAGKRLFVWREQGFGDQILMARFFAELGAAEITYAGQPPLARLFGQLPVNFVPAPFDEAFAIPPHDHWILPLSLPARLGVTLETAARPPYLAGAPRAAGGRIGLVWTGEAANPNQRYRALPASAARRLLDLPGVVRLAPEDTGAADFQATADLIAGLDLVISVDTAVAHLAGAMGKPLWALVPAHGLDWHWLRGRSDSPWHPTARLFRQPAPGDWDAVVDAVIAELARAPGG